MNSPVTSGKSVTVSGRDLGINWARSVEIICGQNNRYVEGLLIKFSKDMIENVNDALSDKHQNITNSKNPNGFAAHVYSSYSNKTKGFVSYNVRNPGAELKMGTSRFVQSMIQYNNRQQGAFRRDF